MLDHKAMGTIHGFHSAWSATSACGTPSRHAVIRFRLRHFIADEADDIYKKN